MKTKNKLFNRLSRFEYIINKYGGKCIILLTCSNHHKKAKCNMLKQLFSDKSLTHYLKYLFP